MGWLLLFLFVIALVGIFGMVYYEDRIVAYLVKRAINKYWK